MTSGATYCGVPQMVVMVPPGSVFSASPKSAICAGEVRVNSQTQLRSAAQLKPVQMPSAEHDTQQKSHRQGVHSTSDVATRVPVDRPQPDAKAPHALWPLGLACCTPTVGKVLLP